MQAALKFFDKAFRQGDGNFSVIVGDVQNVAFRDGT
jgi:hypothetical protein